MNPSQPYPTRATPPPPRQDLPRPPRFHSCSPHAPSLCQATEAQALSGRDGTRLEERTLYLFRLDNPVRKLLLAMVQHRWRVTPPSLPPSPSLGRRGERLPTAL